VKEKLDDEEVLDCKKAIFHIVEMESRNEALPIIMTGSRGKGPKRYMNTGASDFCICTHF
jgi:hypothetical protein